MKTVLLLGAGVTRSTRPLISLPKRPPLDADFFRIAKSIDRTLTAKVVDCLKSLVGDYAESLCRSLETATTYLYIKALDTKAGSPYHTGFLDLLSLLNTVLATTTNEIPIGPRTLLYRFVLSELTNVDAPSDLSIITFNYDLLLERVLDSICDRGHPGAFLFPGCYRLDGISKTPPVKSMPEFICNSFAHEGVALFKLHGSMNWQSVHRSSTPTPQALLNPARVLHVLNSTMIPASLSWRRRKRLVHMKPIIVPPVSGKRSMFQKDMQQLWGRAATTLRDADRVVVAGYSCPPLDLEARILISENMRANSRKRVYVIDPNPVAAAGFLELCGVDHITIYSSISDWVRDAKRL